MKNKILNTVYENRKGHYCHAVQVNDVYELKSFAEPIYDEFSEVFEKEDIIEFLDTMELYCLDVNNDDEVFDFSFEDYINSF